MIVLHNSHFRRLYAIICVHISFSSAFFFAIHTMKWNCRKRMNKMKEKAFTIDEHKLNRFAQKQIQKSRATATPIQYILYCTFESNLKRNNCFHLYYYRIHCTIVRCTYRRRLHLSQIDAKCKWITNYTTGEAHLFSTMNSIPAQHWKPDQCPCNLIWYNYEHRIVVKLLKIIRWSPIGIPT